MEYSFVKKAEDATDNSDVDDIRWKPFLRQVLIAASCWTVYFCFGLIFGTPTVLIPQLRRSANVTGPVTDEIASLLSCAFTYASIPWIFILVILARSIGRKKTFIFISIATISSFTAFCISSTPVHLVISEVISGIPQAAVITITLIIISEYTSPKYRGMFLCIKSASAFWGVWVANAIGTFTHWKYIPVVGFIASLFSLTAFYWPESPHWLATQKRFAECRKAHRWLMGEGSHAERELDELVKSQSTINTEFSFSNLKLVSRREFYVPLSICMLTLMQYNLTGKLVITVYAVEIIKKIIEDETVVYRSMLILDAVTVFSTYIGCYLTKLYRRRALLLIASSIAIAFLLLLSLYLYLVKLSLCSENMYLSLFLLTGFSISISCGPLILSTSLYGELIPCQYKSVTVVIIGLQFMLIHGTLLKVAPLIFKALSVHGTFLFYGLSSGFCLCLIYLYLPETKDKTLLEIAEHFKDKTSAEETKTFVSLDTIDK